MRLNCMCSEIYRKQHPWLIHNNHNFAIENNNAHRQRTKKEKIANKDLFGQVAISYIHVFAHGTLCSFSRFQSLTENAIENVVVFNKRHPNFKRKHVTNSMHCYRLFQFCYDCCNNVRASLLFNRQYHRRQNKTNTKKTTKHRAQKRGKIKKRRNQHGKRQFTINAMV